MSTAPSLVEVVLHVPAAHEEAALAHLLEFAPSGFRHEDANGDQRPAEFGVYVPAGQDAMVTSYLSRAGVEVLDSRVELVPDDYAERWKEFHQSVQIGELWVGPPWQLDEAPAGGKRVVIEPAQGFGTGAHPTTRLMLALLQDQPRAGILDVGCGSGVLSVAAALLGFGPIEAVDNDPLAVESTHENLERNDVAAQVSVRLVDATTERLPRADIVLANLTLEPLVLLAPRVHAARILASGLLRSQVEDATAAFEQAGYVLRETRQRDGWCAIVLDAVDPEQAVMRHRSIV